MQGPGDDRLPTLAAVGLFLLVGLAGCSATTAPGPTSDGQDLATVPTGIVAVADKVRLGLPETMSSEFRADRDPNDPMRILLGRLEFDGVGSWGCIFARSDDGGLTWTDLPRPFGGSSSDPWPAWAPDGTLHAVCNVSNYATSADEGQTWTVQERPETPGNDRPSIHVDETGRLFHCSTAPATNGGPSIVYSDDGGATWTHTPFTAHADAWEDTICQSMEEGPDGTLYTALGLSMFRLAVSTDGGATWTERAAIDAVDPRRPNYGTSVPTHREGNMGPSFAVSPRTGHLFLGIQQYDASGNMGLGAFHLELHRSTDRGVSFEEMAWPTAPADCTRCDVTRPTVHVDDAGRLGAVWRTSELSLPFQTWFAASLDEGRTWLPPVLLSTEAPWQTAIPYRSIDGADHYWHMQSSPNGFVVFWIDRTADGWSTLWSQVFRLE